MTLFSCICLYVPLYDVAINQGGTLSLYKFRSVLTKRQAVAPLAALPCWRYSLARKAKRCIPAEHFNKDRTAGS